MYGDIRTAIYFCLLFCLYHVYWHNVWCVCIVVIQDGWTVLYWASFYGHVDIIQQLLQHNADINIQNEVRNI